MTLFKRIGLFILTNILIMVTISIIVNLLGVQSYLTPMGINYTSLMVLCLVWGMTGAFISLALSKVMAKWLMGVELITPKTPGYSKIYEKVWRLSKTANIPMPEVGVYDSPEINAFATGPTKSSALVAVSTGLLKSMDDDAIDGVIGHEIAHIANGDMVTMTLIQGVVNAFSMFFARVIGYALSKMVGDEDLQNIVRFIVTLIMDILFSILGSMLVAYFSRIREFKADLGGARIAGRDKMIAALVSLQRTYDAPVDERGASLASFKISGHKSWMDLFSTHPSLDDRIATLKSINIR